MARFDYSCEYCQGTVREKVLDREAFKHTQGFVILKDVAVGVCDRCGGRYYAAETLKQVDAIAKGEAAVEQTETVPVATAV